MKKVKISSLPLKVVDVETNLLGIETGLMSRYKVNINSKRHEFSDGSGIRVKTNFKTGIIRNAAALYRVNIYNHGIYEPNIIMICFWMTSGGSFYGQKARQLNEVANNSISFYVDVDGYVYFEISASAYSRFLIEDLSSNSMGFTISTIP